MNAVLTGIGVVSPAGTDKNEFFRSLKVGMHEPRQVKVTDPKLKISRYLDPVSKNAIVATRGAMTDAGIDEAQIAAAPYDYGIVLGTTRGPCRTREGLYESLASRNGRMVSGTLFSHCGYNIAGAMTAIAFGIKGPNITVIDRGDLGRSVLRRAEQFLVSRRARTIFAGVTECDPRARLDFAYIVCLERKDAPALNVEPPAMPLAWGERYRSLFLLGLMSHEHRLEQTAVA